MKRLVEVRESAVDPAAVALLKAWWDVAGPTLARAARPAGLAEGMLDLVVDDRRWQRQIEEVREILMARLRRRRGMEKLSGIRVVVDPRGAVAPEADRACSTLPPVPAPEEILRAAQAIEDDDLKGRWCDAIGRHLQRCAGRPRR